MGVDAIVGCRCHVDGTAAAPPFPVFFGPDGLLYIASGDGGGSEDKDDLAQSLDTLLGKMRKDGFRVHDQRYRLSKARKMTIFSKHLMLRGAMS